MAFAVVIIAAFLSGAVLGLFALLIVGIHKADRARPLADGPRTHLEAVTRRVLGVGTRSHRHDNDGQEG